MKLYHEIAKLCEWKKTVTNEYLVHVDTRLENVEDILPSGSGFDNGCKIVEEKSSGEKLVINSSYHHLDKNGYYAGWSNFTVIVKPCLFREFKVKIIGHDVVRKYYNREFVEYVSQVFLYCLRKDITVDLDENMKQSVTYTVHN